MTPEQESSIRRQFRERRGSRLVEMSAEGDAALARAIEREESGKAENIARCRRLEQLLKEESLAGDLRRGIEADDRDYPTLSAASGLELERLRSFFWGEGDLSIEEIDQLTKALHLRLAPATLS
jgi:hypothetical protein